MKKTIFIITCLFIFFGCDSRTPAQKAQDKFNAQKAQRDAYLLTHEAYIDSLVNVATGLDGVGKPKNRKNALDILRKEYPTMKEKWDRCEECIDNMELFSE
ncbi:hypothetical protein [Bacteroides neonati]|uniref:hypothetical protein n=1 Tax=Bacteroides neonati TaxID=1347393 RepID=UPI0004B4E6A6|nr:hypothetical protein [Bacteroides neonati]